MTTLPTAKDAAKHILRAYSLLQPGDIVSPTNYPQEIRLPNIMITNYEIYLDYAREKGWVELVDTNVNERRPFWMLTRSRKKGTKEYRLTEAGFAIAQGRDPVDVENVM
jgi:hypothetical protein